MYSAKVYFSNLLIFFFCMFAVPLWAVIANSDPVQVQQPDQTWIEIRLCGDEFYHWYEDKNGFTILKDQTTGFWHYATLDNRGELTTAPEIVGKGHVFGQQKGLRSPKALARASMLRAKRDTQRRVTPPVGTIKNLVVLVQFSDLAGIKTPAQFNELFNLAGYNVDGAVGCVNDYYKEVSYDQLSIESTATAWVTLAHGYAYYGANDASGNDVRPRQMVQEALDKLEASGFDFAPFDSNDDGWIDCITIIHAGRGEEVTGNNPNYIWSHQWSLDSAVTYDGIKIQTYHTEPELRGSDAPPDTRITTIGVICHETGHFFGLPDLYDTDGSSQGLGNWCLMAGGAWGFGVGDGTRPTHFSAWCKVQLGWVSPRQIPNNTLVTCLPVETNRDIVQKYLSYSQYLLIENKRKSGFNTNIPQEGLCIWRVDENKRTTNNRDNNQEWKGPGNDITQHYRVAMVQADGLWELENNLDSGNAGDVFTTGNLPKEIASNPNTGYYGAGTNVTSSDIDILTIQDADQNMQFNLLGPSFTGTSRVSIHSNGTQGNGDSLGAATSISADGRYVAFESMATNLVDNDTNGLSDIFVHDRQTGTTSLVSIHSNGTQGNYHSASPSISADGRYVAFHSSATNLVDNDTNEYKDIFVHDRLTGSTTRVSVHTDGTQGNWNSWSPSLSADGRYVAFTSHSTNLVDDDTNDLPDVFVHDCQTGSTARVSDGGQYPALSANGRYVAFEDIDRNIFVRDRQTGSMTLVSVHTNGTQGNSWSEYPSISADGRYVAFHSWATNLVDDDTNGFVDIFVHDRQSRSTARVSVHTNGTQGNMDSTSPSLSADGRYVAFDSKATNLVDGDINVKQDIFVYDRQSGTTGLVSRHTNGTQGNSDSKSPLLSADGQYVAFESFAANLVDGDTNDKQDIFARTWNEPVVITTHPQSQTVDPNASVTFTVVATGTAPLSYQWKKDGSEITGATSSSYNIASAQQTDEGSYTCYVYNAFSNETSNAATLTVNDPVVITTHPTSQTKNSGESATFTVVASGTEPIHYQWKKDGMNLSGATASSYTIASAQQSDEGNYTCLVTNLVGGITSNPATLKVNNNPPVPEKDSSTSRGCGATGMEFLLFVFVLVFCKKTSKA